MNSEIYLKGYLWFFQVVAKCPVTWKQNFDSLWALNKQNCQYVLGLRDTFCWWLGTENKYEISSLPEQFVHPEQHQQHSLPAATLSLQPLEHRNSTESCRGKGLKSFPFTLCKYTRNTWKRKGCQECCWEEGQLFVFCPPAEYNLFKYLHVLSVKDFLSCTFLVMNGEDGEICNC